MLCRSKLKSSSLNEKWIDDDLIFKPLYILQRRAPAAFKVVLQISVITGLCKGCCENKNHSQEISVANLMFWIYVTSHNFDGNHQFTGQK
jgi:hypothetical protein